MFNRNKRFDCKTTDGSVISLFYKDIQTSGFNSERFFFIEMNNIVYNDLKMEEEFDKTIDFSSFSKNEFKQFYKFSNNLLVDYHRKEFFDFLIRNFKFTITEFNDLLYFLNCRGKHYSKRMLEEFILKEQGVAQIERPSETSNDSLIEKCHKNIEVTEERKDLIKGYITGEKYCFQRRVKVYPIPHYYNEPNEPDYIKWSCPVCDIVGEKHQIHPYQDNCKTCGVNLDWEKVLPRGDEQNELKQA